MREYLGRLERSKAENPISSTNFLAFRDKGGQVYDDWIRTEQQFLRKYCVLKHGQFFYVNDKYDSLFAAFGAVVYNNTVTIPLPESFFWYRGMKVLLLMPIAKEKSKKKEETEDSVIDYMSVDFLSLYDPSRNVLYENSDLQDKYINKIRQVYSREVLIRHYMAYLRRNAIDVKVSALMYDNPYEFINTADRQYGTYFEVIHKVHVAYPQDMLYFYFDGIGLCSIIATTLGIRYRSMEMNDIGKIAYKLGIITEFTFCLAWATRKKGKSWLRQAKSFEFQVSTERKPCLRRTDFCLVLRRRRGGFLDSARRWTPPRFGRATTSERVWLAISR